MAALKLTELKINDKLFFDIENSINNEISKAKNGTFLQDFKKERFQKKTDSQFADFLFSKKNVSSYSIAQSIQPEENFNKRGYVIDLNKELNEYIEELEKERGERIKEPEKIITFLKMINGGMWITKDKKIVDIKRIGTKELQEIRIFLHCDKNYRMSIDKSRQYFGMTKTIFWNISSYLESELNGRLREENFTFELTVNSKTKKQNKETKRG